MNRVPRSAKTILAILTLAFVGWTSAAPAVAGEHIVGIGANYWKTVDDLDINEIEDDGLSTVVSYIYRPGGLIGFELDLEYFGDGFAGATRDAYSPQAYIVVGRNFYVAAGVGTTYSSDLEDEITDPYYAAKVGINVGLLPHIALDVNANYRFDAWGDLDQADTDTVFLGALLRFSF
jgi:hypothetical protein